MYNEGPVVPPTWAWVLGDEMSQPYFVELMEFLRSEREEHEVYPADEDVFRALELTPFAQVRVVILGQDPYHDAGQAQGLSFSVPPGVRIPPSLANVFRELQSDLGLPLPAHGDLSRWAEQGVLLLNTVLTVRAHSPGSHKNRGWERWTDGVIRALDAREEPVVFALWGDFAKKRASQVRGSHHRVVAAPHPSPIRGKGPKFVGSGVFSSINQAVAEVGGLEIDWSLD